MSDDKKNVPDRPYHVPVFSRTLEYETFESRGADTLMPPPAALAALQERLARQMYDEEAGSGGDEWWPTYKPIWMDRAASALTFMRETIQGELAATGADLTLTRAQEAPRPAAEPVAHWSDMATAPKDGTMLRLLVNPDQEEFTAFDDSLTPFETIGFNNLADTTEDRWEFVGWDWQQDCFITGRGEVIGWMAWDTSQPRAEPSAQKLVDCPKCGRKRTEY